MSDIMLDIETLGTRPGSVILSIGACAFDPQSPVQDTGAEFYVNIDAKDAQAQGLTTDDSTVEWWGRQSEAARAALMTDRKSLYDGLFAFSNWWSHYADKVVWGHGASFDPVLMEAAYAAVGMSAPWAFYNVRCSRTLFAVAGIDARKMRGSETAHNALHDAKAQARAVQVALGRLRGVDVPAPTVNQTSKDFFA